MSNADQSLSALLRTEQAAKYLGISRRQLYNLAERDPNFPRKIVWGARSVGFRRASLDRYLELKEETGC